MTRTLPTKAASRRSIPGRAPTAYWSETAEQLFTAVGSARTGLTAEQAAAKLEEFGPNVVGTSKQTSAARLLARQFLSPIVLILVAATILAWVLGDAIDSVIILVILSISGLLGFFQERGAGRAIAALLSVVEVKVSVMRDGAVQQVPITSIVPGDVAQLAAGD
ncbi:MAG: cation-transporting P-type ATPase, partial [Leifsonia sp.]